MDYTSYPTKEFLSTPSARRATRLSGGKPQRGRISIHALREEGDLLHQKLVEMPAHFYPRPPRGGRLVMICSSCSDSMDFYPRPPRGGRQSDQDYRGLYHEISIHALREEGDASALRMSFLTSNFYPRPPRGGRQYALFDMTQSTIFLSTPSARRATRLCKSYSCHNKHFYPRPPRGGRLSGCSLGIAPFNHFYPRPPRGGRLPDARSALHRLVISIHALREEGDTRLAMFFVVKMHFYPRPPRGGRLDGRQRIRGQIGISIHALREEGDGLPLKLLTLDFNFYPRPPRGGRRSAFGRNGCGLDFYPRPPRGGRHEVDKYPGASKKISIHALREEGDARQRCCSWKNRISIHALREEGDALWAV